MVALSHDEVVDQLKKLGITADSELMDYSKEYSEYFSVRRSEEQTGD